MYFYYAIAFQKNYWKMFPADRIYGNTIRLEASTICQLKCVLCFHGTGGEKVLGNGYLKFGDFKNFIDRYPVFKSVELSNYGEIFLNPDLQQIIEYAFKKGVSLTAYNGANLNTVSENMLECLVRHGFKHITVSLDGASNQTYSIYRVGGNFDKVIENIKKINYYKHKYNTKFPLLYWQFVIFGHNEHELAIAQKMAQELHMEFRPSSNWSSTYSPVSRKEATGEKAGYTLLVKYEKKNLRMFFCQQLWTSPQINWDGRLLGCCCNRHSDFGNVFRSSLESCIKKRKICLRKKNVAR
jgi:MoaA/NifB/PqqE/SkfB family radical SAM enzyme